ncbi:MAG: UDP-N-acetylmuramoyl-L-alanine--D-glutamate ligase, partial [Pseudomonadota bacterium]
MIPVQGFTDKPVFVLGMGRTGLTAARALREGGAHPICWDDGEAGRTRAANEGFDVQDPLKHDALSKSAALIVSPGIPHLYPAPHPVIAAALTAGVPVDNDIGLFFRSYATRD